MRSPHLPKIPPKSSQRLNEPNASAIERRELKKIYTWINEISSLQTRENALLELCKKQESVPDLAPMLWHSFGTAAALLEEILNVYPSLNPPTLTARQSNRICGVLTLLQRVAAHPETRDEFVSSQMLSFILPFLHTVKTTKPFEFLRLATLGVIGALVKPHERSMISFLLDTELVPLCLRIMDFGCEMSKTLAGFILQMILMDDVGLLYVCQTYDRFSHVAGTLGKMVLTLLKKPSPRRITIVLRCYMRLSDDPRARQALRRCLPQQMKDNAFTTLLEGNATSELLLAKLMKNLQEGVVTDPNGAPLPGCWQTSLSCWTWNRLPQAVQHHSSLQCFKQDISKSCGWVQTKGQRRQTLTSINNEGWISEKVVDGFRRKGKEGKP